MTSFEDHLKKWNGGILRGAQFRLAKVLRVDQSNIRRWMEGETSPKEELRPRVAKVLKISVDALMASLKSSASAARPSALGLVAQLLSPEEMTLLKESCEKDLRSPEQEIRWLVRSYSAGELVKPGRDFTLK